MRSSVFPCPQEKIPHYTAYYVDERITIDGRLDEECWKIAPRSSRFVDLLNGRIPIYDTYSIILWDDKNLYVGFWVEEPFVTATLTKRDSPIYNDNDVELFIAGRDAYYEFEINAFGTIYEVLFIWEEAYEKSGYSKLPELRRDAPGVQPFYGVGFKNHPRGPRIGFWNWDFPGLKSAVHVDGTLNDNRDRDRGWTVEIALPWEGMKVLAMPDNRSLPPKNGDVWRINCFRFNQYKEAPPAEDSGGWAWNPHYAMDSHIPECFPFIHFSTRKVTELKKPGEK
ncbi:MAG: polyhydroxyalkanoate depolymerase [Thaumarchaeota archaeon]|nr:polyhydroxyalkanoate depolymerase [Nitrososphaerota archaeon]